MFEIGSSLREARERRGLSYADVELGTKVRSRYIKALEDERFDILPGPTYTKGFLRAYADYLGLDGNLYIDEFNSAAPRPAPRPRARDLPPVAGSHPAPPAAGVEHRADRAGGDRRRLVAGVPRLRQQQPPPTATLPIPAGDIQYLERRLVQQHVAVVHPAPKTIKNQVPAPVHRSRVAVSGGDCWVAVHKWRAAGPAAVATNGSSLAGLVVKDGQTVTLTRARSGRTSRSARPARRTSPSTATRCTCPTSLPAGI